MSFVNATRRGQQTLANEGRLGVCSKPEHMRRSNNAGSNSGNNGIEKAPLYSSDRRCSAIAEGSLHNVAVANNCMKLPSVLPIIDPTSLYGKVEVPLRLTMATKGRDEWLGTPTDNRKELSLCCLFQKGKCHASERCHQVHVDRDFVISMREKYQNAVVCCMACGDVHSQSSAHYALWHDMFPQKSFAVTFGGDRMVQLPAERLANTAGLLEIDLAAQPVPTVSFQKVCRLHLRRACKYGKDCKNIHICSECSSVLLQHQQQQQQTVLSSVASLPAKGERFLPREAFVGSQQRRLSVSQCSSETSNCATPEEKSRSCTPAPQPQHSSVRQSVRPVCLAPVDAFDDCPISPLYPSSQQRAPSFICETSKPTVVVPEYINGVLASPKAAAAVATPSMPPSAIETDRFVFGCEIMKPRSQDWCPFQQYSNPATNNRQGQGAATTSAAAVATPVEQLLSNFQLHFAKSSSNSCAAWESAEEQHSNTIRQSTMRLLFAGEDSIW